jgi:hypothetical protein
LIDQLRPKHGNQLGFPTRETLRSNIVRDVGAIVFEGQTNARQNEGGAIHFPVDDDDEIDLSGSFKPSKKPATIISTYANCGGFSQSGNLAATSSNSGVFVYPNGTKVSYANCVIVHVIEET